MEGWVIGGVELGNGSGIGWLWEGGKGGEKPFQTPGVCLRESKIA